MISSIRPKDTPPAPAPQPPPPPLQQDVEFSYNSQDSVVMPTQPALVHGVMPGPSVEKAELIGGLEPNADGKYVYDDCDQAKSTAAISFSAVAKTIETMSAALGQPISWAFDGPKLGVIPDDGEDFNAYYARDQQSVHFFHGTDPVTNANIMSGASGEVCSHECGHAILDGLRPGYFSSWTPDVGAFHESFGDMVGMLMAFQDDRAVGRAAIQCGGDLTKPNCIADTGEQLGVAINDYVGSDVTGGNFVRTARNGFKWADPSTLPDGGGPDQLGSEVHSFSRLWTGAFYDVLVGVNAANLSSGMEPKDALKATGQEGLKILTNAMKEAPQGDFTYRDMANAFVTADQKYNGGKNADLITKAMTDRGILGDAPPAPTPDPAPDPIPDPPSAANRSLFTSTAAGRKPLADVTRTVQIKLSGPQFGMFNGAKVATVVDKDGSLAKDAEVATRTRNQLAKLISQGKVRYNDPGYQMKPKDYFDPKTKQPYAGVVRWEGDQMVIEHTKIAT